MRPSTTSAWLVSGILTAVLYTFFLWVNRLTDSRELLLVSPFFIGLYGLIFSIGEPEIGAQLARRLNLQTQNVILFPLVLIGVLYGYLGLHGHSPFQGTAALFPFYLIVPLLYFLAFKQVGTPITWIDFVLLLLYIIPATSISFGASTNFPLTGSGFGSVLRFVIMLAGIYSFGIIRGVPDIGFYPVFRFASLLTTVWVWLAFFAFTLSVGYAGGLMRLAGHDAISLTLIETITRKLINIFFATALFEELFFRGLLQNYLTAKITTDTRWQPYWQWGLVLFLIVSGVVGYFLKPKGFWLPMLTTVLLFAPAWFLDKKKGTPSGTTQGTYTALAIISIFFGLVHAHSGSLPFVVLASIAGWAYGYVYLKTKNVFYAALVHTLVNGSEFIFGLELIK